MSIASSIFWCSCLLSVSSACERSPSPVGVAASLSANSGSKSLLHPYPPGRWRLDTRRIGEVVLWVSQILIRHDEISAVDPCFNLADWRSSLPAHRRSRADALALAQQLAEQAQQSPGSFAELARAYSEDICTRERGGSFGGIRASQFQLWPEVLDTLANTPPGRVSQVVETRYGYHLFYRRSPPAELTVSGARIVIAHDEAGWIKLLPRGTVPQRSRSAALALASDLAARAARSPEEFGQLVEEYSEHGDALRGGDMGTWSTREPTDYPREVEILAELNIGQVAPPLDSPVGFEIIQRSPNKPRQQYAVEQIRLPFNPELPAGERNSQTWALEKAQAWSSELLRRPALFAELQEEHCCAGHEQWADGRGSPALSNALDRLAIGQFNRVPIRSEDSYVLVRRINPIPAEPSAPLYDLPEPRRPNIAFQLRLHDDAFAVAELVAVGRQAQAVLGLQGERADAFLRLHQVSKRFAMTVPPDLKEAAFESLLKQVEALLGEQEYQRYLSIMDAHFERLLFGSTQQG